MIKLLIVASMLAALTIMNVGCSSKNDAKMSGHEALELTALAQTEETRTENVEATHAKSIESIVNLDDTTGPVKILGIALVNRDTAEALMSRLPEILQRYTRSAKGTDVQIRVVEGVEKVAPIVGMAGVAITTGRAGRGSVENRVEGGGDIQNTLEETHATALGDNSPPVVNTKNPVSEVVFAPELEVAP